MRQQAVRKLRDREHEHQIEEQLDVCDARVRSAGAQRADRVVGAARLMRRRRRAEHRAAALAEADPGAPSRSHQARRITASPSSRKVRVSPLGSVTGCLPPSVSSSSEPPCPGAGPDSVPVPSRSPGRRLQPLTVWCASSCADASSTRRGSSTARQRRAGMPGFAHRAVAQAAPRAAMSIAPLARLVARRGTASGCGSPAGRVDTGARNGASASSVTIHGEIVVAKFFARNGPERLVLPGLHVARRPVVQQHERRTRASRPRRSGSAAPERVAGADEDAELELVVEAPARAEHRRAGAGRQSIWPCGRAKASARSTPTTSRGRDSRSAPTCSSAAAGCRAGTACRRSVA